ncbi:hypothetical protein, partial [Pasteurella bettyae]
MSDLILTLVSFITMILVIYILTREFDTIKINSSFVIFILCLTIILQIVCYVQPVSNIKEYSSALDAIEFFFFIISGIALICV